MELLKKLKTEEKINKMDKSMIRKQIYAYRNSLSDEFVDVNSRIIFEKIVDSDWYKETKYVFLYASYNNEVDTKCFFEYSLSLGKIVCAPKVSVDDTNLCKMNFYKISSFSDFMEGYKGIPEPVEGLENVDDYTNEAIIIIPMVAFNENRTRIGYGKGFYDRYLASHSFKKIVGVAFEGQKVENIQKNPFDISPEIIYTEEGIY